MRTVSLRVGEFPPCRAPFLKLEGHTKGVLCCDWSPVYKIVASGGADKSVCVFNPFSGKRQACMTGHAATITDIVLNDNDRQIISLSMVQSNLNVCFIHFRSCPCNVISQLKLLQIAYLLKRCHPFAMHVMKVCLLTEPSVQDKAIKVWDIRNYKCLQTISDREVYKPDNTISGLVYNPTRSHLVTGNTKLKVWQMERVEASGVGAHGAPVSQVIFNRVFEDAVSADRSGVVCFWNVHSGALRSRCDLSIHGLAVANMSSCSYLRFTVLLLVEVCSQ
jgi:WD40 repeat protein